MSLGSGGDWLMVDALTLTSLQRKRYLFVCINRGRGEQKENATEAIGDVQEASLRGVPAGLKLEVRVCTSAVSINAQPA